MKFDGNDNFKTLAILEGVFRHCRRAQCLKDILEGASCVFHCHRHTSHAVCLYGLTSSYAASGNLSKKLANLLTMTTC